MPVGEDMGKILNRRRHDITPGGLWLRRPAGVVMCTGEDSVKDTAVGVVNVSGEGKSHVHIKPDGRPGQENPQKNQFNIYIGRPLLMHDWKPNQAEACNMEERDGRGNAKQGSDCDGSMHECNVDV